MLVLSRKVGEAITIGDDIRIVVTSIRGKQMQLGIEAPDDLIIGREETNEPKPSKTPVILRRH